MKWSNDSNLSWAHAQRDLQAYTERTNLCPYISVYGSSVLRYMLTNSNVLQKNVMLLTRNDKPALFIEMSLAPKDSIPAANLFTVEYSGDEWVFVCRYYRKMRIIRAYRRGQDVTSDAACVVVRWDMSKIVGHVEDED